MLVGNLHIMDLVTRFFLPPVALTELDPQALFRPGVNIRPERSDHKLVGCEMHCGRIRDLITHTTF